MVKSKTESQIDRYDRYGNRYYFNEHGQYHKEDGPAIEHADGSKIWYIKGQPHREDGPAVEDASGTKEWYIKGQPHREDGPAVERADGSVEYWLFGERIPKKKYTKKLILQMKMTRIIEK